MKTLCTLCRARHMACVLTCMGLLAACSRPAPDAVVHACLTAAAAQRYDRALAYCGPPLHMQYSNHLWLAQLQRQMAETTAFTVDPPSLLTSSSAHVRVHLDITMRGRSQALHIPLRADLVCRDKWYIETVWLLGPDGQLRGDVFEHLSIPWQP